MSYKNKEIVKAFFETGDTPTQSNFEDLIDSLDTPSKPITMLTEGDNEFVIMASCIPRISATPTPVHGEDIPWVILMNDSDHGSSFYTSIEVDNATNGLKINFPTVKNVLNHTVTSDEAFQTKGLTTGAAVGLDNAIMYASRSKATNGYLLTGNNTNWTASGGSAGAYSLHSLVAGLTTLQDNAVPSDVDYREVQISYVGENNYRIKRKWSGLSGNAVGFYLVDVATNLVVTDLPTADDRLIVSNYGSYRFSVNLAEWVLQGSQGQNGFLGANNYWCFGMYELWMIGLNVSSTENHIKWQLKTGVTTYNLYRDTDSTLATKSLIYSGTLLEFIDSGLTVDTMYYYQLEDQTNTEITRFNTKTKL